MSIKVQNYHLITIAILLAGVLCFQIVLKKDNSNASSQEFREENVFYYPEVDLMQLEVNVPVEAYDRHTVSISELISDTTLFARFMITGSLHRQSSGRITFSKKQLP